MTERAIERRAGKKSFICVHCGRRVYAEPGALTQVHLCRSCFEKARKEQGKHQAPGA